MLKEEEGGVSTLVDEMGDDSFRVEGEKTYRHCPPHGDRVGVAQTSVGVQISLVAHGWEEAPTVQGVTGGMTWVVRQRPPQGVAGLQVEEAGQGSPFRMQGIPYGFENAKGRTTRTGKMVKSMTD